MNSNPFRGEERVLLGDQGRETEPEARFRLIFFHQRMLFLFLPS